MDSALAEPWSEEVDEHPEKNQARLYFEYEFYPEPKALLPSEMRDLYDRFKSFDKVAECLGCSEAFVRHTAREKLYRHTRATTSPSRPKS